MTQMVVNGEANYLVAERVWQETAKAFTTAHPSAYLNTLLQIGALACIAPELNDLLHRVADITDKDNNMHLFTALDQASKHLPEVLLAILSFYACRNSLSINSLGERWKLSSRCKRMIRSAEQFDGILKSATDLSSGELLDFLEQAGALRNRVQFENLLTAYELSNYEGANIEPQISYVTRALDALETVDFGPSLKGLPGSLAKEQARKLQLEAINSL